MNETRAALLGLGFGFLVTLVATGCSGDDASQSTDRPVKTAASEVGGSAAAATATPAAATACPSDVAAPKRLVADGSAMSLQIVGDQIYYQSAGGVMKVGLDGSGPTTVFTSTTLTQAWVDGTALLVIESPNAPDAVVRVIPLADAPQTDGLTADAPLGAGAVALPATWNAAGTKVFAADGTSFFLVADQEKGQSVYSLGHTDEDAALTKLADAEENAVVSSMQVTEGALWFVRDNARVYKAAQPGRDDDGAIVRAPKEDLAPKEQFKVDANGCDLAVAGTHALCIRAGSIERRDLNGANPTTLFDLAKSRVQSGFGSGIVVKDHLLLRSGFEGNAESQPQKAVIRDLTVTGTPSEKILACGRTPIGALAANPTQVVWVEQGENAGIWLAPR